MVVQARRTERAQRINSSFRLRARLPADGWEAVTTPSRRAIEYSQPVLYSHFASKDAIVAVALRVSSNSPSGCIRCAHRLSTSSTSDGVAQAYLDFGFENPALYDAMFTLNRPAVWPDRSAAAGSPDSVRAAVAPLAGDHHLDTFTGTFWSALHGLVTLTRAGRLRQSGGLRLPCSWRYCDASSVTYSSVTRSGATRQHPVINARRSVAPRNGVVMCPLVRS